MPPNSIRAISTRVFGRALNDWHEHNDMSTYRSICTAKIWATKSSWFRSHSQMVGGQKLQRPECQKGSWDVAGRTEVPQAFARNNDVHRTHHCEDHEAVGVLSTRMPCSSPLLPQLSYHLTPSIACMPPYNCWAVVGDHRVDVHNGVVDVPCPLT